MTISPPASGLEEATREQIRLRGIISGATGSGKTATGLIICNALRLRYGGRIGVIDTQHRQSLNYVKTRFAPEGFIVKHLDTGNPEAYINAIKMFKTRTDITALLIDGLSDAWQSQGGVLDSAGDNAQFSDWRAAKGPNFDLLREIQRSPFHVVCTVLADTQYLIRTAEGNNGKQKMAGVDIIGTKPVQDKKMMPKFDLQMGMDQYHTLTVFRTSFPPFDRLMVPKPDEKWFEPYMEWMEQGDVSWDQLADEANEQTRIASPEQVEEFYRLCALHNSDRTNSMLGFVKKFGSKPEETTEEFLEEKLKELRAKKPPVTRSAPKTTQPPITGEGK